MIIKSTAHLCLCYDFPHNLQSVLHLHSHSSFTVPLQLLTETFLRFILIVLNRCKYVSESLSLMIISLQLSVLFSHFSHSEYNSHLHSHIPSPTALDTLILYLHLTFSIPLILHNHLLSQHLLIATLTTMNSNSFRTFLWLSGRSLRKNTGL